MCVNFCILCCYYYYKRRATQTDAACHAVEVGAIAFTQRTRRRVDADAAVKARPVLRAPVARLSINRQHPATRLQLGGSLAARRRSGADGPAKPADGAVQAPLERDRRHRQVHRATPQRRRQPTHERPGRQPDHPGARSSDHPPRRRLGLGRPVDARDEPETVRRSQSDRVPATVGQTFADRRQGVAGEGRRRSRELVAQAKSSADEGHLDEALSVVVGVQQQGGGLASSKLQRQGGVGTDRPRRELGVRRPRPVQTDARRVARRRGDGRRRLPRLVETDERNQSGKTEKSGCHCRRRARRGFGEHHDVRFLRRFRYNNRRKRSVQVARLSRSVCRVRRPRFYERAPKLRVFVTYGDDNFII